MPVDLWTPGGVVQSRDQIPLTLKELNVLAWLHEWAVKNGVSLVCQKCDGAIVGTNSGHEGNPSVKCTCREWVYRGK
jgi:hypothetical protein